MRIFNCDIGAFIDQDRPVSSSARSALLICVGHRQTRAEREQQAKQQSSGNPQPAHNEVPSIISGRIIAMLHVKEI
jgi:hypothetical protein